MLTLGFDKCDGSPCKLIPKVDNPTLVSPDISAERPRADPQVREQGQPARHAGGVHLRHALPALQGEVPQGVLAESTGRDRGTGFRVY